MEITKENTSKQVGRPRVNRSFTLIRIPTTLHTAVREIADKEQRAVQIITERIMNKGLEAEGYLIQKN